MPALLYLLILSTIGLPFLQPVSACVPKAKSNTFASIKALNLNIRSSNQIEYAQVLINALNSLKCIKPELKWNSTIVFPEPVDESKLKLFSKSSFSSKNYMEILRNTFETEQNEQRKFAMMVFAASFYIVFLSVLLPSVPIPVGIKNAVGLFALSSPFIYITIDVFGPKFQPNLQQGRDDIIRERVCYHEAGHFIAAYLCGLPVFAYNVDVESNSSLEIEIPRSMGKNVAGNLLVVALAGVVAESLRFGNTRGGLHDFSFASAVLKQIPEVTTAAISESYLRWAAMKSLSLLRIHRDILDEVASSFYEGKSVIDCMEIVENGALS